MKTRVLVVGDEPELRRRCAEALAAAGYDARECAVDDGHVSLRREAPSLVLVDVGSSGTDGMDLLSAVQREGVPPAMALVPPESVSLVTGSSSEAAAYFPKPVHFETLQAKLEALAPPRPDAPEEERPKVLVADDDMEFVDLAHVFLRSVGYQPLLALSGRHVADLAEREMPVAILLDLVLPGADGFHVLRRLKARQATAGIPVFIMSALGLEKTKAGAKDPPQVVPRDCTAEELVRLVKRRLKPSAKDRPKVLVADDEAELLQLIKEGLEADGFDVSTAVDGKEALERLRAARPDLAVVDFRMPRANGLEVCRAIHDDPKLRGLPVIVLSAAGDRATVLESLGLGACDFLPKPIHLGELATRIRSVLRERRR